MKTNLSAHAISCVSPKKQNFPTATPPNVGQQQLLLGQIETKKEGTVFAFGSVPLMYLVSRLFYLQFSRGGEVEKGQIDVT